jgi:hypothetical protein
LINGQLNIEKAIWERRVRTNAELQEINDKFIQIDVNSQNWIRTMTDGLGWKADKEDILKSQVKVINMIDSSIMRLDEANMNILIEYQKKPMVLKEDLERTINEI